MLAVVGYHAFPSAVPGGFVGVDVFFVISGYLITAILRDALQQGTFSFAGFYARRARRILPALALVLAASAVAGWFLLDPPAYRQLGRHLLASGLFVPNLALWRESGYFDAEADLKPLLHLWSLGIEEQFYLLWPVALWLGWRQRWWRNGLVLPLALASFATAQWLLRHDPAAAFYLPQARAWELLCGASIALARLDRLHGSRAPSVAEGPATAAERDRLAAGRSAPDPASGAPRWADHAAWLAWPGAALLAGSIAWLDDGIAFPGAWALPPVLGTCLLIIAGPGAWLNRQLLSQRPLVLVGLISYPLYLWHWPLLVFAGLASAQPPSPALRVALVVASLVLAWLTYRLIEAPVRRRPARRWQTLAPGVGLALAATAGLGIVLANGFDRRIDAVVRGYADYAYEFRRDARSGTCWLTMVDPVAGFDPACAGPGNDDRPLVLVWGDSHAARLTPGLREVGAGRFRVAQYTRDGCRPFLSLGYPVCLASNAAVLRTIARLQPDTVVLFAFWTAPVLDDEQALVAELERSIAALVDAGVGRVVVVGPSAEWNGRQHALPRNLVRLYAAQPYAVPPARTWDGVNPIAGARDALLARALAPRRDAHYFSAYRAICDRAGCMTRASDDPQDLMTWDYGHLTTSGAVHVARALDAQLGGLARPRPDDPARQ